VQPQDERVHQTESVERAANKRKFAIEFAMFCITHTEGAASSFDAGD